MTQSNIPADVRERIIAAAAELYDQAGRENLPTVDAVRRAARADMNTTSAVMREWRRAQTAQAAPVAVGAAMMEYSLNKMNALRPSMRYALLAGLIAIVINTALLQLADFIPLQTARGGLLKLLQLLVGDMVRTSGLSNFWLSAGLPAVDTATFKVGFHVFIGLIMAVLYAVMLEPFLTGSDIKKGLLYALLVWLVNAVVVLPWIGEGFAGNQHLSLAGMLYFAMAHTVFFVLLSWIYARLTHRK